MTKKDYERIANAVKLSQNYIEKEYRGQSQAGGLAAMQLVATMLGKTLYDDNPNFDFERFYKACGQQV